MRFEKLGKYDYAVYVDGFSDCIGKAGKIGDDCWFQARADLGGEVFWEMTMLDAVGAWARAQKQRQEYRLKIEREMLLALIAPLPTERYDTEDDEDENGIFIEM